MLHFYMAYPLKYLSTGHILIDPEDDCERVVDAILETQYTEEFCIAPFTHDKQELNEEFIQRLMEAGFLVMSTEPKDENPKEDITGILPEPFYILLPKLHLIRSILFFHELHIKKSIRHFLSRYELRVNSDFDFIMDKCVQVHGDDWLTQPLVKILKSMHTKDIPANPISFGVYRDGKLKAGEIGVAIGRVYTSYTGYYEENNAGTVQTILMAQWLEKTGFSFLDFGMPLDYKTKLGARDILPRQFVELFRKAR